MNKERVVSFLVSALIFFILLFLYSKFGPSLPVSVLTQEKGEPMVVSGIGKVTVVPDIAKITVGVEETGRSIQTVQESVNQKSKAITDELKKLRIDEKDIKTVSYNVYPEYNFESPRREVTGYRVSSVYEVKVREMERVNEALEIVTAQGANVVGGISLEVNDETRKQKLNEARELAANEAREKAEGLARASGISLGRVINVSEHSNADPKFIPLAEASNPARGGDMAADANIQPGETEIEVSVSLSFEVR